MRALLSGPEPGGRPRPPGRPAYQPHLLHRDLEVLGTARAGVKGGPVRRGEPAAGGRRGDGRGARGGTDRGALPRLLLAAA
ncbi:MAG: hypothetical protein RMK29_20340, partial [Myxococcales bacterium]|nr:hypothetical protein [Myxococcales bacterium]